MSLSASELFRLLRDERTADQVKLQAAETSWRDPSRSFPKQREFLLEWCLGRMLKAKDDQSPQALVASASCWMFVNDLLQGASSQSTSNILTKIPTLPIFNALLARHKLLSGNEEISTSARSVFQLILPLSASRATADAVSQSLALVYDVLVVQEPRCGPWSDMLAAACRSLPAALALTSPAVHKKIFQQFMDQHLRSLLAILATSAATLSPALLEAAQVPLSSIVFGSSQLHKTLNHPAKQDVDFVAGWRNTPEQHRAAALPYIFSIYVKSLKAYAPTFVASAASTSRSVTDAQSTLLTRQAAFALLNDATEDAASNALTTSSTSKLLHIIHDEHLYAPTPGHSEQWKAVLHRLLTSACSGTSSPAEKIESLALNVQIEPALVDSRIEEVLGSLDLAQPGTHRFFSLLRSYYVRTRRLSDYLDALVKASSDQLPPTEREPLAHALSTAIPPAQSLALCSTTLQGALEDIASLPAEPAPPHKKQKRSSVTSKKSQRHANVGRPVVDAVCLVLEHVEVPFSDQQTLATQVCEAFTQLQNKSNEDALSSPALQLSVALVNWMLQHESSMAGRLAGMKAALEAAASMSTSVLRSSESSYSAQYHALLLAFSLAAVDQESALLPALDFVLGLMSRINATQEQTQVAITSLVVEDDLAMAVWTVVLAFLPSLSVPSHLEKLAEVCVLHFRERVSGTETPSIASATFNFLRSPLFSQTAPEFKSAFHAKLAKEVNNHAKLSRFLIRLPYAELSSHLRKRALEACSNPKKVSQEEGVAFLAAHLQAGGTLPALPEDLEQRVQHAVRPKEDVFAQLLPSASKEAIGQALELLTAVIQQSCLSKHWPSTHLATLESILCQAPSSCSRQVSESFALVLRALASSACMSHDSQSPAAIAESCSLIASVTASQSRLLDHSDVAVILSLYSSILRPSSTKASARTSLETQQMFTRITSTLSTLVRHRKDIMVAVFPALMDVLASLLTLLRPLSDDSSRLPSWAVSDAATVSESARVYGRLLTNITAKTVQQKSVASKRVVSSLQGPLSKHAGYFLLAYLRACTGSTDPLSPSTRAELAPGLYEIVGCMNKYERDAVMNGLLSARDEAERVLLRALWKDYDRARYKGQA